MISSSSESEIEQLACSLSAFDLSTKHIVVTGGGRGLGRGIALSAALAGATVTIVSRSADELNETVRICAENGGTCIARSADLSDIDSLAHLADEIWSRQPIDGVIHAAGVQVRRDSIDVTPDDWEFVQTMNLQAPFFLSTRIAKAQIASGRQGSHIFVGSLNSSIGLARIAPYAAAKTALLGVARVFSTEWARFGIRANVVAPGYFHTKLTADLLADEANYTRILGRIPAGRLGVPADLGGICIFLLSDASMYVSGQLINVDGGWLAA
jgi:2-deoxy-D-gluconate 3-dehydrogenase